jgi:biopolymer transport protein ExbB
MNNPLVKFLVEEWFIAIVLVAMSVATITVVFERLGAYKKYGEISTNLLADVLDLLKAGRDNEATRAVNDADGPVAAVARVVLANARRSVGEVERLVQEAAEDYFMQLEKNLAILDTITTLSPLWGLFGTIVGMIQVFLKYAVANDDKSKQSILPSVGTALYATAGGILIALVCFIAYNYFVSRRSRIIAETEQAANKLINVLEARGTFAR